ncbi:6-carboxyhexanoate--CoA ligase [Staphylococcus delphini]|uniref:6-carboxyhexanoate--CoA ligase n=1 Tax=Staphylococcus delphini TaxID=53344 RepID=UPI0012D330AB|nr:6-carboxyhexanoate--CoA ligase [Staphylococcus delphini]MTV21473.1 6-carboxyhexanoate--CoA ligase [Staphylococcus delphini]
MYSVKMRAHQDGIHISGAETICEAQTIPAVLQTFFDKGFQHENGAVDFLNLKIEKIADPLYPLEALPIIENTPHTLEALCEMHGITKEALDKGMGYIFDDTQYRGAVIVSAQTGERLDQSGTKGVRVTHFCFEDHAHTPLVSTRIQDALTIATCITAFAQVKGELCVSDDLHYTTGYFASAQRGYHRIHHLKPVGTRDGGRVIFVDETLQIDDYIAFLQQQPKQVIRHER